MSNEQLSYEQYGIKPSDMQGPRAVVHEGRYAIETDKPEAILDHLTTLERPDRHTPAELVLAADGLGTALNDVRKHTAKNGL